MVRVRQRLNLRVAFRRHQNGGADQLSLLSHNLRQRPFGPWGMHTRDESCTIDMHYVNPTLDGTTKAMLGCSWP